MPLKIVPDLHRAVHQIGLLLESQSAPRVNQAEAHILAHLSAHGDSTVAELHQTLGHKRSTLTSVLDRLTTAGFVTRITSDADRRSVVVRLTASGKRAARDVYRRLADIEEDALASFSGRAVENAVAVLDALEAAAATARSRMNRG